MQFYVHKLKQSLSGPMSNMEFAIYSLPTHWVIFHAFVVC